MLLIKTMISILHITVVCVLCSSCCFLSTFGRQTLVERLPKVLTQIIDTVHRYRETVVAQHKEVRKFLFATPTLTITLTLIGRK